MPTQRDLFTTRLVLAVAACLAFLAAALPSRAGAQAPTSASLLAQRFTGVTTPGSRFDLVQSVIDFGPGARSSEIAATTAHFVSAVEGDLVADVDGSPQTITASKGLAVPSGARLVISNPNTARGTRAFVSTLLPPGATASVHQLASPGVSTFATSRMTMSGGPATVDIVHSGARYDAGFRGGVHTMNEPHLMTHTEGLTGYTYLDGLSETYRPQAQGEMYVGRAGYMHNVGTEKCSFLMTWVSAPGTPLTTAVAAAVAPPPPVPAPPNTGSGVVSPAETHWPATAATAALGMVVLASLLAGMSLRRRSAS